MKNDELKKQLYLDIENTKKKIEDFENAIAVSNNDKRESLLDYFKSGFKILASVLLVPVALLVGAAVCLYVPFITPGLLTTFIMSGALGGGVTTAGILIVNEIGEIRENNNYRYHIKITKATNITRQNKEKQKLELLESLTIAEAKKYYGFENEKDLDGQKAYVYFLEKEKGKLKETNLLDSNAYSKLLNKKQKEDLKKLIERKDTPIEKEKEKEL